MFGRSAWGHWDAGAIEIGLHVQVFSVNVARGVFDIGRCDVGRIGLHGLARRFERGGATTDDAVLGDLTVLADTAEMQGKFRIATTGGWWVGNAAITADRQRVAAVRAFINGTGVDGL